MTRRLGTADNALAAVCEVDGMRLSGLAPRH